MPKKRGNEVFCDKTFILHYYIFLLQRNERISPKIYLSTSLTGQETSITSQLTSVKLDNLLVSRTRNNLFLFSEDDFDVRRRRHEGVDSTMSTVSTTTVLGGLVNNNTGDGEFFNIQTLGLKCNKYQLLFKLVGNSHTSALLSAFFKRSRMNLTDLTGQRP